MGQGPRAPVIDHEKVSERNTARFNSQLETKALDLINYLASGDPTQIKPHNRQLLTDLQERIGYELRGRRDTIKRP
jgi:transposase